MANRAEIKVTPIPGAGMQIARSPEMREWMRARVADIASDLRADAPVKTGAGRGSIASDTALAAAGWEGSAGWDEAHYYMGIQQSRTHWADPAVADIRYV
jgi:hypothetical protein